LSIHSTTRTEEGFHHGGHGGHGGASLRPAAKPPSSGCQGCGFAARCTYLPPCSPCPLWWTCLAWRRNWLRIGFGLALPKAPIV